MNMPELEDLLEFKICVGNKPLKEHRLEQNGEEKFYVEANLFSPSSYFIVEKNDEVEEKYPVTPYVVKGSFYNQFSTPVYLKLSVDSQQIWMKPFPPGSCQNFFIRGYKCRELNEVRELLFTLPRLDSNKENIKNNFNKEQMSDFGTIKMECLEAIPCGTCDVWNRQFKEFSEPGDIPSVSGIDRLHKSQAAGATTRDGRVLSVFERGHGRRRMTRYRLGDEYYGKKVLHYRTRHSLMELGINDVAWKKEDEKKKEAKQGKQILKENRESELSNIKDADNMQNCSQDTVKDAREIIKKRQSAAANMTNPIEFDTGISKDMRADSQESTISNVVAKIKKRQSTAENITNSVELNTDISNIKRRISEEGSIPQSVADKLSLYSPSGKLLPDEGISDMEDIKKEMNVLSLKKSSKLFCFSPTAKNIKKCGKDDKKMVECDLFDGKEYRVIEIDDDLCMLEEIDDDVVWMGDDSCCFMDVTPPEIPLVDLCDVSMEVH